MLNYCLMINILSFVTDLIIVLAPGDVAEHTGVDTGSLYGGVFAGIIILAFAIIIIALIIRQDVQFILPFNCRNDKYLDVVRWQRSSWVIVHFTVACLVAKPLNRSEVKGDLVMIQMLLLFKCKLLCYHPNQILVSITTWLPSASLQIKGLATQYMHNSKMAYCHFSPLHLNFPQCNMISDFWKQASLVQEN